MFNLVPAPQIIEYGSLLFPWNALESIILPEKNTNSLLQAAIRLADDFEQFTGRRLRFACGKRIETCGIILNYDDAIAGVDAYHLDADAGGVEIRAASENGVFYGIQTLRQMLVSKSDEYPETHIRDYADYGVRGFYHDVTRGAVPKLETLFQLVDKMAYYKLNQLQLYIEHTFALAKHSDIWEGADPLTPEEILRLQEYCLDRHIDLVPSISTFGHFYMAMRSKRLEDLNELEVKGSERPFSFVDRMAHDTLNPSDGRSIELVRDILDDFLPLFKSSYCNICCDETFDLGKGKNAPFVKNTDDIKELYVDFLKKIISIVQEHGKTAMFWGDIIGERPDLIKNIPGDFIPLEWDYSAASNRRNTEALVEAGHKFYVCPGTSVWDKWFANSYVAQQNILNYAKKGLKYGAAGLLNTNWGDFGNVNLPSISWYGLIYGAACSWNTMAAEKLDNTEADIDCIEFGAAGLCNLCREFSRVAKCDWGLPLLIVDPNDRIPKDTLFEDYKAAEVPPAIPELKAISRRIDCCLKTAKPIDLYAVEEIRFGVNMTILMHEIIAAFLFKDHEAAWKAADNIRRQEVVFCRYWHRRNKPSEYYRVKQTLLKVASKLDEI